MTSIFSIPQYYCEIRLSEKEYHDLMNTQWEVDIFRSTHYKPVKGTLVIPGCGRSIEDGKTDAWLWISSPRAKANKDTLVSVSIVSSQDFWEGDSKDSLIKLILGKKFDLHLLREGYPA